MARNVVRAVSVGALGLGMIGGAGIVAAVPAQAAVPANASATVTISAPTTVWTGQMFKIKCTTGKANRGMLASVQEKGAPFNAHRTVGDCTMRVYTWLRGTHKFRIVLTQYGGALVSNWVTIRVR